MADQNRPGGVRKIFEGTSGFIASATIIIAAFVHVSNFLPQTLSYWFPEHKLALLGFFNQERLSLANEGDYDYYISYLTYNHDPLEVRDAVSEYGEDIANYLSKLCDLPDKKLKSQLNLINRESCHSKVEKVKRRLAKVEEIEDGASNRTWVPGKKERPIAESLAKGSAREFKIPHSAWYGCPEIPIIKSAPENCSVNDQKKRALALFAVSYQAFPINCVEANYYYSGDRAYQSIIEQEGYLKDASIKSHAAFHYYSKDPCTDETFRSYLKDPLTSDEDRARAMAQCPLNEESGNSSAETYFVSDEFCEDDIYAEYLKDPSITDEEKGSARQRCAPAKEKHYLGSKFPGTILRRDLPDIVSLIRYKPTPFCAAIVKEIVGANTFAQTNICTGGKAEDNPTAVPTINNKVKFPDCSVADPT